MNPIHQNQLIETLQWRYATKSFDPSKSIPGEQWEALKSVLVLTPSSYGLQPYQFLVIESPEVRNQLLPHSWNQRQVVDASKFLVFAARTSLAETDIDEFISLNSSIRGVPAEALNGYRNMMVGDLVQGIRGKNIDQWASKQAYIALGNLMTSAALLGIDTCPMEGLNPVEYDRILRLEGSGFSTVVACALGYRASNDKYASLAKVRFPTEMLIRAI